MLHIYSGQKNCKPGDFNKEKKNCLTELNMVRHNAAKHSCWSIKADSGPEFIFEIDLLC